jgi:hypothetical protein
LIKNNSTILKKPVGYPSVSKVVWHLVLIRTYADDVWVPSDPGQDLVQDDPPFGALQFTVDEVQSVLLELDACKGARAPIAYRLLF